MVPLYKLWLVRTLSNLVNTSRAQIETEAQKRSPSISKLLKHVDLSRNLKNSFLIEYNLNYAWHIWHINENYLIYFFVN